MTMPIAEPSNMARTMSIPGQTATRTPTAVRTPTSIPASKSPRVNGIDSSQHFVKRMAVRKKCPVSRAISAFPQSQCNAVKRGIGAEHLDANRHAPTAVRVEVRFLSRTDDRLALLGRGRLLGRLLIDIHDRRPFAVGRKARREHETGHRLDRRWVRPGQPPNMAFGRE